MKLKRNRLLAYNVLAIIKVIFMITLFLLGFMLIIGEDNIERGISKLILFKIVGGLSIYLTYRIYDASANRER